MSTNGIAASVEKLTKILWKHDVMNTSCNVNECMEDEYQLEAMHILDQLNKGTTFKAACFLTFSVFFWEEAARAIDFSTIESEFYEN